MLRHSLGPSGARFLASRAKAAKASPVFDLGWDQLRKELLSAPLALPQLKKLDLTYGRSTDGSTGARHFHKNHFAALRYQNPELIVSSKGCKETKVPTVFLELRSGESTELKVGGERQISILRRVLSAAGAADDQIERAVHAAEAQEERLLQLRREKEERYKKVMAIKHETWTI